MKLSNRRLMAARVKARFVETCAPARSKIAVFTPYEMRGVDPFKEFAEAKKDLGAAFKLSEKLLGASEKYEKRAKDVQKDGADVMEEFVKLAGAIDPKKLAPYIAKTQDLLPKVKAADWTTFLGVSGPLTDFHIWVVGEVPRKLRAFLKNRRETDAVKDLEKYYNGNLAKVHKASTSLYDDFEKEVEKTAQDIADLIRHQEIMLPRSSRDEDEFSAEMRVYDGLHYQVNSIVRYPTQDINNVEERFKTVNEGLKQMLDIVEKLEKAYKSGLYGSMD